MNIIVCVDKSNGMMFNNRRQSQDKELVFKIIELSSNGRLLIGNYSAQLFSEYADVIIDDNFISLAQTGDYCFIENTDIPCENIEKFYIFNWNRDYPADTYFEFDLKGNGFKRLKKEEFAGNSHNKITLEIFGK